MLFKPSVVSRYFWDKDKCLNLACKAPQDRTLDCLSHPSCTTSPSLTSLQPQRRPSCFRAFTYPAASMWSSFLTSKDSFLIRSLSFIPNQISAEILPVLQPSAIYITSLCFISLSVKWGKHEDKDNYSAAWVKCPINASSIIFISATVIAAIILLFTKDFSDSLLYIKSSQHMFP